MTRKLYDDQYEEERTSLFWWLFCMPGAVMLWWGYMFPGRGRVYASGRRYKNRVVEFMYSTVFWAVVAFFAYAHYVGKAEQEAKANAGTTVETSGAQTPGSARSASSVLPKEKTSAGGSLAPASSRNDNTADHK